MPLRNHPMSGIVRHDENGSVSCPVCMPTASFTLSDSRKFEIEMYVIIEVENVDKPRFKKLWLFNSVSNSLQCDWKDFRLF